MLLNIRPLWQAPRFKRRAAATAALVFSGMLALPSYSQTAIDPAAARAEVFSSSLLTASKRGEARSPRLHVLIEQSFNIPVMAQIAVGPSWSSMSAAEHTAIVQALVRYTAARFEHDLGHFNGQKIVLDPAVQVRGPDHLIKGQLFEPGDAPVRLAYRIREYDGAWRIIDVFYDGVSQLATQRADFASSISSGAAAFVKKLDEASAKLRG
jgi:phospholipid transport system substrate-binding protein